MIETNLDERLQTSKERQEKLLQIFQDSAVPEVPNQDMFKFEEYIGHSFQNPSQSIYCEAHKAMFGILYDAEKQAEQESGINQAPNQVPIQQILQWQPDP